MKSSEAMYAKYQRACRQRLAVLEHVPNEGPRDERLIRADLLEEAKLLRRAARLEEAGL